MRTPSFANEPVVGVNVIALPQSRLRMQDLDGLPLILMPVEYCLWKMVEAGMRKGADQDSSCARDDLPREHPPGGGGRGGTHDST